MRMAIAVVLLGSVMAGAQEQAALATLQGVNEVLVRSAHEGLTHNALGLQIESRLRSDGLFAERGAANCGRLYVEVIRLGFVGFANAAYEVRVSLEEPVTLGRSPGVTARAVTWRESRRVGDFNAVVAADAVIDAVDVQLDSFVRSVRGQRNAR
jgi:hypothetical protein